MKKLIPNVTKCLVCKTRFAVKTDDYGFHSCDKCETFPENMGTMTHIVGRTIGDKETEQVVAIITKFDS